MLAALVVAGYAMAHVLSGDAEVRISARVLDDGRTELALQQRSDGEWGDRVLPRARFFPAEAEQDQWLNSTPLTIETTGHESDDKLDEELRSAKEELAKTQQALADAQKLVGVDIAELIAELEAAEQALEDANAPPKIVREVSEATYADGRITTSVAPFEPYGVTGASIETELFIRPEQQQTGSNLVLGLGISCNAAHGVIEVGLRGFTSEYSSDPTVEYRVSPKPADTREVTTEQWTLQRDWSSNDANSSKAISQFSTRVYHWLRNAETLDVTIFGPDFEEDIELSFDLDGVFETLVQPNLDYCGQYY